MPGFNLVRNSKVFFTSNVNASTGVIAQGALTAAKTQQLSVMNGFSFSQAVDAQVITVSEAGDIPARGQRSFNSAIQPVEFNFTTYIRPKGSGASITADELVLWNAMFADGQMNLKPSGTTAAGEFAATATSITRGTTTNTVVYAWSAIDISNSGIVTGDKVNVGNVACATLGFNGSGTITLVGTTSSCSGATVLMDTAPAGPGNPTTTTGTVYFSKASAVLHNTNAATGEAAHVHVTTGLSNKNQLQKFGIVVIMDQATYLIDNCVLNQAQIDFGLDGIAQIQWSGQGTVLRTLGAATASGGTFGGTLTGGTYTEATVNTSGTFITNKVSTATLKSTFMGQGTSNKTYTVALTGGSLTIANNVNFVTPETLGVVNQPIGYFTGTRAVSGSITAYLKTSGTNPTNTLLTDLLSAPSETKYYLEIQVGGVNNANKVELEMNAVTLQIPTIEVQDVVSTTINFAAQPAVLPDSSASALADNSTSSYYDVEAANDIVVRYYSTVA